MRLDISGEAQRDIAALHHVGMRSFGEAKAARYTFGLLNLLDLIAANPRMARIRPEFRNHMRAIPYRSHIVFYRIAEDSIHIVRVLHGKQNWLEHL